MQKVSPMSPLSILIHLRLVDLPLLQQRFDDCLFQVSFCMDGFLLFTFYFIKVFPCYTSLELWLETS